MGPKWLFLHMLSKVSSPQKLLGNFHLDLVSHHNLRHSENLVQGFMYLSLGNNIRKAFNCVYANVPLRNSS